MSLHIWHRQGLHKPSSCATYMLNSHWGRAATGKKSLASMCTGSLWSCPTVCGPIVCGPIVCGPIVCARLLCQGGGFSRQAYWCVLANTGCHPLLEHYISCCPGRQPPWGPGAARTPAAQAAAPPPHQPSQGNPSPPGQPQELSPSGWATRRGGNKPQLKPRGSVAQEEDPKPSHWLYKLQIKSTRSTRQTLCLWKT